MIGTLSLFRVSQELMVRREDLGQQENKDSLVCQDLRGQREPRGRV